MPLSRHRSTCVGRQPQHALQRALGAGQVAFLDAPHLDVVLQPQQHLAVFQRQEMLRLQFGLVAGLRFQHRAQIADGARDAAAERIDDRGRAGRHAGG